MAIQYNQQNKLFQVDYQSPFGGIDSTAYASAIDPHNFTDMSGIYIEDNVLTPLALRQIITTGNITGNYLGYIPIPRLNNDISDDVTAGYIVTSTHLYSVTADVLTGVFTITSVGTYAPSISGGSTDYFHYLVLNTADSANIQLFWTALNWSEIWTYDGTSITQLTAYVGGGILGLLDNQLLVLGGVSAADGQVPNRISWSAPGEYGQFQPYDVTSGTGNYAAGFNDLPSTSDVLTGFAAIGTVGYLFRTEGITQVNPTGNGIQPFQFNHL